MRPLVGGDDSPGLSDTTVTTPWAEEEMEVTLGGELSGELNLPGNVSKEWSKKHGNTRVTSDLVHLKYSSETARAGSIRLIGFESARRPEAAGSDWREA